MRFDKILIARGYGLAIIFPGHYIVTPFSVWHFNYLVPATEYGIMLFNKCNPWYLQSFKCLPNSVESTFNGRCHFFRSLYHFRFAAIFFWATEQFRTSHGLCIKIMSGLTSCIKSLLIPYKDFPLVIDPHNPLWISAWVIVWGLISLVVTTRALPDVLLDSHIPAWWQFRKKGQACIISWWWRGVKILHKIAVMLLILTYRMWMFRTLFDNFVWAFAYYHHRVW